MEKKKHILVLPSWYPNRKEPTNGNFIREHVEVFASFAQVSVLYAISAEGISQMEMEVNEEKNFTEYIIYYPRRGNKWSGLLSYFQAMRKGWERIYTNKPDIVHVHVAFQAGLFALWLKRKYNYAYIISEHWSGYLPENWKKQSIWMRKIHQYIYRNAAAVTAVSGLLLKHIPQTNTSKRIIGNVVKDCFFSAEPAVVRMNKFIHVSNFAAVKNTTTIIDAALELAKEVPDFELHMFGEELPDKERCRQLAKNSGLLDKQIFIHDFTEPEKLATFMSQSLAYISMSEYETQGLSMLEAMAAGLPVISSNIPAMKKYMELGFAKTVHSKEELVKAMHECLTRKSVIDSKAMKDYIYRNSSSGIVTEQFKELYEMEDHD